MILPFSMGNIATAQEASSTVIDKAEDPTEFVGTLKEETRQIGGYLLVKHTYTSSDLNLRNVDHIYREEIVPVDSSVTQQEIDDKVNNPEVNTSHEMIIVHESELTKIDKIQSDSETISAEVFQQWTIVEMPDAGSDVSPVSYYGSLIQPTSTAIEDWASKKDNNVYTSYDPINLVWTDTVNAKDDDALIDKVETKLTANGWNDSTDKLCGSTDLYVNISGIWTKQDKHFKDRTGLLPCYQYHARVWEINDNLVIGSGHEERLHTKLPTNKVDIKHVKGGVTTWERDAQSSYGFLYHILDGFDSGEDEIAGEFSGGCWSVSKDSRNLNNMYTRSYYNDPLIGQTTKLSSASNDGRATDILCS